MPVRPERVHDIALVASMLAIGALGPGACVGVIAGVAGEAVARDLLAGAGGLTTGVATNWLSDLRGAPWTHAGRRMPGDTNGPDRDLAAAVCRAFLAAIGDVEQQWRSRTSGPRVHPAVQVESAARDIFRGLREDGRRFCTADRLASADATGESASRLLVGDPDVARTELASAILAYLGANPPDPESEVATFIAQRLGPALTIRLGEELLADNEAGNRAWRAFQRLTLLALQRSVTEVGQGQTVVLERLARIEASQERAEALLAEIRSAMRSWDRRLGSLPPEQRDRTGEEGLEIGIAEVRQRLEILQAGQDQLLAGQTQLLQGQARLDEHIHLVQAMLEPRLPVRREQAEVMPRQVPPTLTQAEWDNRRLMLEKVEDIVARQLEESLHGTSWLVLGLEHRPEAVPDHRGLLVSEHGWSEPAPLTVKVVTDAFDEFQGQLLILGAPGAGKTSTLLDLARVLIGRAQNDDALPMPVVFNLASWANKHPPLAEWLIDELAGPAYGIPRKIARLWVDGDQILPLLDGLDEVAVDRRVDCVTTINTYVSERAERIARVVVCSRLSEYDQLPKLRLGGAILVRSLTDDQVQTYLGSIGEQVAGLRSALQQDAALLEMATTPLFLNLMVLAYQGAPAEALPSHGTVRARREALLTSYVLRMFSRRGAKKPYYAGPTVGWLAWLARQLSQHSLATLHLEQLQPDWLATSASRRRYEVLSRLIGGLVFALGCGLFMGPVFGLESGLAFGSFGLLLGARLDEWFSRIVPVEVIRWSIRGPLGLHQPPRLVDWLVGGLLLALIFALGSLLIFVIFALFFGVILELVFGLDSGFVALGVGGGASLLLRSLVGSLVIGLVIGLVGGLGNLLDVDQLSVRTSPNEGIHRSGRYGAIVGLGSGLLVGLVLGLTGELVVEVGSGLLLGLGGGIAAGLFAGAQFGGQAYPLHFTLRYVLWREGGVPLNYVRFLEYATERIFLRRVGGGYQFIHRLVQEHFASHEEELIDRVRGTAYRAGHE